ncbi:MAG: aspartate--tRNA(Asn) ligase [Chloroflexota bacterium]
MMAQERSLSVELTEKIGEIVTIKGWFHNLRDLGTVNFLLVRDAWGVTQCIVTKAVVNQLRNIQVESVIEVSGTVVSTMQAPNGLELHDCTVTVLETVSDQIPFEINQRIVKTNLDTFLNHAQIGLRHPQRKALLRLSNGIIQGFRQCLLQQRFTEIQTPKLVGSATEGGANVFSVEYFDQTAYLAQSPQLYKQMMVGVLERVFEVGTVFRAEPHNTSRHINEYTSLDVELGFIENHHTVMGVLEVVIKNISEHLFGHFQDELNLLRVEAVQIPTQIPKISFVDAQQIILEQYGQDCQQEKDLTPQQERWLGEWALQNFKSDFLFVTEYPMAKRPFYTHPHPENECFSNSFDLLFRGLELTTGGQRLHRYQDYLKAMEAYHLNPTQFQAYLDTFKYGMPPHGGFAIGLQRFLLQLTKRPNIKEVTLFPRDRNRLSP